MCILSVDNYLQLPLLRHEIVFKLFPNSHQVL